MSKTLVIFSGKKSSGKDTAANFISKYYERKHVLKLAFADEMKQFLHKLFKIPLELLYGTDEDKNRPTIVKWKNLPHFYELAATEPNKYRHLANEFLTIRQLMQEFGTGICRKMFWDCWTHAFYTKVEASDARAILCNDGRYPNELDYPTSVRRIKVRMERVVYPDDKHSSETGLDDYNRFDLRVPDMSIVETENFLIENLLPLIPI